MAGLRRFRHRTAWPCDDNPEAGGLLARLQPALRAAEARGVLVNVQVIGDPGIPPPQVADVVLLDLDLDDGSTVERNVADILAAGPAVPVLSASDKPVAVRAAMRAGRSAMF